MLDKFDRAVFESIVEKVIVGDMNEDGIVDPYKLTFVLKGMDDRVVNFFLFDSSKSRVLFTFCNLMALSSFDNVSSTEWITKSRTSSKLSASRIEGTRKKYSRKFAFSSMCECGFCGKYLTRRAHNQTYPLKYISNISRTISASPGFTVILLSSGW